MKAIDQLQSPSRVQAKPDSAEVAWRGKLSRVPAIQIKDKTVVVLGKWIKLAVVHDEEWLEGELEDPGLVIESLAGKQLKADIFTFAQKLPNDVPQHKYYMEWDNVAAIPTASFNEWWEHRLPQVSRKNVRRAAKRGVVVRSVRFDDELVRGIMEIQNETLIKQGTLNVHHGKDFATVMKDYSSFLDRSEFFGAYCENEFIGFIKVVYMGRVATLLNILCMTKHYDKRPANALLAKVVETCCARQLAFLIYGKYFYGNKTDDPLTEFKRRNGFEKILVPRYYIPLTLWGKLVIKLHWHRGAIGLLPGWLITMLVKARAQLNRRRLRHGAAGAVPQSSHLGTVSDRSNESE